MEYLAGSLYVCIGAGLLGGWKNWNLPKRFLYTFLFPIHSLLWHYRGARLSERSKRWCLGFFKLLIWYGAYRLVTGYWHTLERFLSWVL